MRIRLTGWAAIPALKRELLVPLTAVRAVRRGHRGEAVARAGHIRAGDDEAHGRPRREGRRFFLALSGDGSTLLLEADPVRAGYASSPSRSRTPSTWLQRLRRRSAEARAPVGAVALLAPHARTFRPNRHTGARFSSLAWRWVVGWGAPIEIDAREPPSRREGPASGRRIAPPTPHGRRLGRTRQAFGPRRRRGRRRRRGPGAAARAARCRGARPRAAA